MPVTILIPAPLRELAGGKAELVAAGATVGEVLAQVARAHPRLGARLLDESGQVRRYVGLFLGDEEVRELGGLGAAVRDGDRISLVPAIAGGAPELDGERIARWARQLLVPGFGAAGQERLMASRVRVVGADGSATPALLALVQAGVGTLWIDDPEAIGPADLCGWLYAPEQVGQPRAAVAAATLARFSRFVAVAPVPGRRGALGDPGLRRLLGAGAGRRRGGPARQDPARGARARRRGGAGDLDTARRPLLRLCPLQRRGAAARRWRGRWRWPRWPRRSCCGWSSNRRSKEGRRIDMVRGVPSVRHDPAAAGLHLRRGVAPG